ncbi:MAG: DUF2384 domain-containing protein [Verrucomicrobiae bacterium]|nr:DUF2384 domain-containing protein [Verrucomicrobiae bacterium]
MNTHFIPHPGKDAAILDTSFCDPETCPPILDPDRIAVDKWLTDGLHSDMKIKQTKDTPSKRINRQELDRLLKPLANPEGIDVDNALRIIGQIREALLDKLKTDAPRHLPAENAVPRASPLDRVKIIMAASGDLRVPNGNLSSEAIAKLYGISMNMLSTWLGRTRQALNKTPDADSLQNDLGFFERIARLRTALNDDDEFRKWLRMQNPELNHETPIQWIEHKRWQPLADFVDDMLTGATS